MVRNLSILGATGSIGRNTLRIVDRFPDRFSIKALSARSNMTLLAGQIERYRPVQVAVGDERSADDLSALLPPDLAVDIVWVR